MLEGRALYDLLPQDLASCAGMLSNAHNNQAGMQPGNDKQTAESDRSSGYSRLNPVTLVFQDPLLERNYRAAAHRHFLPLIRFGLALAIILFTVFGLLDLWNVPELIPLTWSIRLVAIAVAGILFWYSFTDTFSEHRQALMAGFLLLAALCVAAILAVLPDKVMDQYYAAYIVIVVSTFVLFGLRFLNAVAVAMTVFAIFMITQFAFHDDISHVLFEQAIFIFSCGLVAGLGGYSMELHRRLAYHRRRRLEEAEAVSAHEALHDPLTGLPNRRLFTERLAQALRRDDRFHTLAAVLFIDLDAFKSVNDRHGHAVGDKLLQCVAERLQECIRATDMVGRLGGDEFVVLLEDLQYEDDVRFLHDRIKKKFEPPCVINGIPFPVAMSIGCAIHPRDGDSLRELVEVADRDMYRAKRERGDGRGE